MGFPHDDIETFRVTDFDIDTSSGEARLRYLLGDDHRFEELIGFGPPPAAPDQDQLSGLEACVRLLHLAAGVSYFKAAAPPELIVETGGLRPAEARLVSDLYDKGLREFAYGNGIESVAPRLSSHGQPPDPAPAPPSPGLAVPIGGGKDSIVVLEALRRRHPVLVSVNPGHAARRVAHAAGLDLLTVERRIDPHLFELNAAGALNGHVPITAIVSLIVVAAGYLFGFDTTVMALESSADEPTRVLHDAEGRPVEVNHQWSKSSECEAELAETLHESVHPGVRYLSALREVDELDIARAFAGMSRYHDGFRSCNRAFRLSGAEDGWCRDCPKCRFVYLALATALDRPDMVKIFGGDMLADDAQVDGFAALLEADRKPFECVGTVRETAQALKTLAADPRWQDAPVVQSLAGQARAVAAPDIGLSSPDAVLDAVRRAVDGARAS